MRHTKLLSQLLQNGSPKLKELSRRSAARDRVLTAVRRALPAALAAQVVSAGCESGRLTIGTHSAAWGSRLRYVKDDLRVKIAAELGVVINTVRVKIVPPAESPPERRP